MDFVNQFMIGITAQDFILRCTFATIAGLLVGLERQLKGHGIGVKTTVLLSLGACVFVLVAYSYDPTESARMAAAVATGIGFLCSGTIFRGGLSVKGLNTSATIWICAGIGCLVGIGNYGGCVIATCITIIANLFVYKFSDKLPGEGGNGKVNMEHAILFEIKCSEEEMQDKRRNILEYEKKGYVVTELLEKNEVLKAELTFFGIPNATQVEKIAIELNNNRKPFGVSWKLTR